MINSIDDLPVSFSEYIIAMVDGRAAEWVAEPVPALSGKSILDLANEQGLGATRDYLNDVGARIGVPYAITPGDEQVERYAAE